MASTVRFDTLAKHQANTKQQQQSAQASSSTPPTAKGKATQPQGAKVASMPSTQGPQARSTVPYAQSQQYSQKQFNKTSPVKNTNASSHTLSSANKESPVTTASFEQQTRLPHQAMTMSHQDQQNQIAAHIFSSSGGDGVSDEDDCNHSSDNDEGGDSDFEPPVKAIFQPGHRAAPAGQPLSGYLERGDDPDDAGLLIDQYGFASHGRQQPETNTLYHDELGENVPFDRHADAISYKLAAEEHLLANSRGKTSDYRGAIYDLRHQVHLQNYMGSDSLDQQSATHIDATKGPDKASDPLQGRGGYANAATAVNYQQYRRVDSQEQNNHSDSNTSDAQSHLLKTTSTLNTKSSNVRRFARNTATYQASFTKQAPRQTDSENSSSDDEHTSHSIQRDLHKQCSSDSSDSKQFQIDRDFVAHAHTHSQPVEMKELNTTKSTQQQQQQQQQRKTWQQSAQEKRQQQQQSQSDAISEAQKNQIWDQAAHQVQKAQIANKPAESTKSTTWVEESDSSADRFKSTAVGFSPAQTAAAASSSAAAISQQKDQQKSLTSFGWSQQESSSHIEQAAQYGQYAMLYPQKQISKETWDIQTRNMQQTPAPTTSQTQKEKRKKKQPLSEAHFLLTGYLAHHLENRTFFRNTGTYDLHTEKSQPGVDANSKQALMKWFASLTVQDRINSLTTTYPIFTHSIIEAQWKNVRANGPLCIFQLKKDKSIEAQAADTQGGRRRIQQVDTADICILERVACASEENQRFHQNYYSDQSTSRGFQTKMLKFTRITHNKNWMDTLTVGTELVRDPDDFFSLVENVTDGKAFSQPIPFAQRNGSGGRTLIQSPRWIDSKKSNYLAVWIVAILEETLWAHFNYAKNLNIPQQVSKHDLNKLFELRSEKLQDPEDLAQRWKELGGDGQQKLLGQLSQHAKDNHPTKFQQMYEEQERRANANNYQAQHAQAQYNNDELYQLCNNGRFGLYSFSDIPTRQLDYERDSPFFSRTTQSYMEQGMLTTERTTQHAIGAKPPGNILMFMHNDTDLKEIIDIVNYLGSPIDLIKYLSEIPLQEVNSRNYIRKHNLQHQLHSMIQADLRQAIQEKLINDCLQMDSDANSGQRSNKYSSGRQDHSVDGNGGHSNGPALSGSSGQANGQQKGKNKKNKGGQDNSRTKNQQQATSKRQTQQQAEPKPAAQSNNSTKQQPQYQKKKLQSQSKSPVRGQSPKNGGSSEKAPMQQKQQNTSQSLPSGSTQHNATPAQPGQKRNNSQHTQDATAPETNRVPSTTTSDDQQADSKHQQKMSQAQSGATTKQQSQQQQRAAKSNKKKAVETQDQILKHVRTLLGDLVKSVCDLEQERSSKVIQEADSHEQKSSGGDDSDTSHHSLPSTPATPRQKEATPPAALDQSGSQQQLSSEQNQLKISTPTPGNAQQQTQQQQQHEQTSHQRRRRKPRKKVPDLAQQLNNYMRSVCGEEDTHNAVSNADQYVAKQTQQSGSKQTQQKDTQKQGGVPAGQLKGDKSNQGIKKEKPRTQPSGGNQQVQQQKPDQKQQQQYQQTAKQKAPQPQAPTKAKQQRGAVAEPQKLGSDQIQESSNAEEPQPIICAAATTQKDKVLPEPQGETTQKQKVGRPPKMEETQTISLFGIENQPAKILEAEQANPAVVQQKEETLSEVVSLSAPAFEPVQLESAEVPLSKVKISLTEHFQSPAALIINSQNHGFDSLSSLQDFKPQENVFTHPIDFQLTQAQAASNVLPASSSEQTGDPTQHFAATWPQASDIKPVFQSAMSTTSVSFTPTGSFQPVQKPPSPQAQSQTFQQLEINTSNQEDLRQEDPFQQLQQQKYQSLPQHPQPFFQQQEQFMKYPYDQQKHFSSNGTSSSSASNVQQYAAVGGKQTIPAFQKSQSNKPNAFRYQQSSPPFGAQQKSPQLSEGQRPLLPPSQGDVVQFGRPTQSTSSKNLIQFSGQQASTIPVASNAQTVTAPPQHHQKKLSPQQTSMPADKQFFQQQQNAAFGGLMLFPAAPIQSQQPPTTQQSPFIIPQTNSAGLAPPTPIDNQNTVQTGAPVKTPQIRLDAPAFQPIPVAQPAQSQPVQALQDEKRTALFDQPSQQPSQLDQQYLGSQGPPRKAFQAANWNQFQFNAFPGQQQQQQQQYYDQNVPMAQHPLFLQLEEQFYRNFDKDIEVKTTKIQQMIEKFEPERQYVVNKLQKMADRAFPNRSPVIRVFGSLMTGLALETSDMDIAVTGMRIDSRDDMVDDLHLLGDQVQSWDLIKDFKKHEKASIPVIKAILFLKDIATEMGRELSPEHEGAQLPIDISFDDSPPEMMQQLSQPQLLHHHNSMPMNPHSAPHDFGHGGHMMNGGGNAGMQMPTLQKTVSQDPMTQLLQNSISEVLGFNFTDSLLGAGNTFGQDFGGPPQPKTHLGLASCQLLKDYVQEYRHLKKVAVLLKKFLAENNLNNAYLGGISSYSAVLLIVAYINYFKLYMSPSLTPSRLLMGFLDFYSNCFDPRYYGVNTSNKMSFYQLPQVNHNNFVIQDPVNLTNNTARNSHRTADILNHFRAAFYSLKSQITKQFHQQLAQQEALREQEIQFSQSSEMAKARLATPKQWSEKAEGPPLAGQKGEKEAVRQKHSAAKKQSPLAASSQSPQQQLQQPQQDPTTVKASEQQQPQSTGVGSVFGAGAGFSFVPAAQAFDSVNFVDCFLSEELLREESSKQANVGVEALSYFQR